MKTLHCGRSGKRERVTVEVLETRRFLSGTLPATIPLGSTLTASTGPVTTVPNTIFQGTPIYAVAGETFEAVLGTFATPVVASATGVPTKFTLSASINWGDGSALSAATLVPQADGVYTIEGSHTYTKAGSDGITITITRVPSPGSTLPVVLVGTIHSTATVVPNSSGVTLNETAGSSFTVSLGTFSTELPLKTLSAVITWGDGAVSIGKIVALPGSSVTGGLYEVVGTHAYAKTASYLVNISVTSTPTATPGGASSQVIVDVADIQSVIDLLPMSSVIAPAIV